MRLANGKMAWLMAVGLLGTALLAAGCDDNYAALLDYLDYGYISAGGGTGGGYSDGGYYDSGYYDGGYYDDYYYDDYYYDDCYGGCDDGWWFW